MVTQGPMCTVVEIILPSSTFKDSYIQELLSYSSIVPSNHNVWVLKAFIKSSNLKAHIPMDYFPKAVGPLQVTTSGCNKACGSNRNSC